jgi:mutator protein MutT
MRFSNITNLCYIINKQGEILLQFKSKGFGQGKWNGPGGKVESGETPEESVRREVKEETGISINHLKKSGDLEFLFKGREEWNNYCHVFVCNKFEGGPKDKGEGKLQWFKREDLPFDKMWADDIHWLPDVLQGRYVKKRFYFDREGNLLNFKILNNCISEL